MNALLTWTGPAAQENTLTDWIHNMRWRLPNHRWCNSISEQAGFEVFPRPESRRSTSGPLRELLQQPRRQRQQLQPQSQPPKHAAGSRHRYRKSAIPPFHHPGDPCRGSSFPPLLLQTQCFIGNNVQQKFVTIKME